MALLNIYLIRHGEKTEDGKSLTKKGKKQALLLTKRLKNYQIDKVYSSDIPRCKETFEIINKRLKLPFEFSENLREVKDEVKEHPKKHVKEIDAIKSFWNLLMGQRGKVLVVSSGNVNRILLSFALNVNSRKCNFTQNPSGVNLIQLYDSNGRKKIRLLFVNDTSHLSEKLKISHNQEIFSPLLGEC